MKQITNLAVKFLKEHWNEIDLVRVGINEIHRDYVITEIKTSFIKKVKNDETLAAWVLTEVMRWGTDVDYLKPFIVETNDDELVIKIRKRYFQLTDDRIFKEVKPKFKKIIYFE